MAEVKTIKLKVDATELQTLLDDVKEMLGNYDDKIKELEGRIEAIERCPAIEGDLG